MPTIIAIVECAGRSGWLGLHSAQLHALGADLAEHPECPPDVGDARLGDLLVAERLRCHKRQQQASMLDDDVVELFDEMARQFALRRSPRERPPATSCANSSTKLVNGRTSASRNSPAFEPKCRKSRYSVTPAALGDLARGGAAVILAGEQFAGGIEQKSTRFAAGPAGTDCRAAASSVTSLHDTWSVDSTRSALDSVHY